MIYYGFNKNNSTNDLMMLQNMLDDKFKKQRYFMNNVIDAWFINQNANID